MLTSCSMYPKIKALNAQLPSPRVRLMEEYCSARLAILSLNTELPSRYSAHQIWLLGSFQGLMDVNMQSI